MGKEVIYLLWDLRIKQGEHIQFFASEKCNKKCRISGVRGNFI